MSDAGSTLACVCLHEYAHLAVARAFGASGFVRIRRIATPPGEPPRYAGSFQMYGELGEREWRVVALAGTIAEWMHECPAIAVDDVMVRLTAGGALSSLDARLARGFDRTDVVRCTALLREHWGALLGDAVERVAEIEGLTALAALAPGTLSVKH